jgi:hypothetical protein
VVLGAANVPWHLPADRVSLFAAYVLATAGAFFARERSPPCISFDISYRVAVLQVAFILGVGTALSVLRADRAAHRLDQPRVGDLERHRLQRSVLKSL